MLAAVVARLRREDPVAQAIAGIFMEAADNTVMADQYYKQAGPALVEKINSIFSK